MKENRRFKLKSDKLRENDDAKKEGASNARSSENVDEKKSHDTFPSNRTLSFKWPDGRKIFFNYAYLVSGELNIENDVNVITLHFTSNVVTIKGYGFEGLFSLLTKQSLALIIQQDQRYSDSGNNDDYAVIDISIVPT